MKKFVAFALVLSLGLFCAIGCKPATPAKPKDADKGKAAVTATDKAGEKAGEKAPAAKTEEPAAKTEEPAAKEEPKTEEKK